MDGDQKLNIMSPCLYQQWQGVTDLPRLHLHQAICITNPMTPKR